MKKEEVIEKLKDYSEEDLHQIRDVADHLFDVKRELRKADELTVAKSKYEGKWYVTTVHYHGISYNDSYPYKHVKKYFYVKEVTSIGNDFIRCTVTPFIKIALEQEDSNYLLANVKNEQFLKIDFFGEYKDYDFRLDGKTKECSKSDVETMLSKFDKKLETIKKSI
jgi:hypothetical protein